MQEQNLKIHYRNGKYVFTEHELQEMREAIPARIHNEILPRQRQIKDLKDQIKSIQAHIDSLSDTNGQESMKIEDGFEDRRQDCYRLKNYGRRCFEFFSIRDQSLIFSTAFEREDHQIDFHFVGDIEEITDPENYTRTLYHDGKLYSFGPRKIVDDSPSETVLDVEVANDGEIKDGPLRDYPTLEYGDGDIVQLKRNKIAAFTIFEMSQKDEKIWKKYVKAIQLTEQEIDDVNRYSELPF